MKQRKRQPNPTPVSLKDFFQNYDSVTLIALLNTFEQSLGWKVYMAWCALSQRDAEVNSLDKIAKGENPQACFASGYAKACEDMGANFIDALKKSILAKSDLVEHPREEEKEPLTQFD